MPQKYTLLFIRSNMEWDGAQEVKEKKIGIK